MDTMLYVEHDPYCSEGICHRCNSDKLVTARIKLVNAARAHSERQRRSRGREMGLYERSLYRDRKMSTGLWRTSERGKVYIGLGSKHAERPKTAWVNAELGITSVIGDWTRRNMRPVQAG